MSRSTRDVQSRGAIAPNRVRNPSIRVSSNCVLEICRVAQAEAEDGIEDARPTSFRLACRIFECIRSRSLLRRFRRGFGVSSRSVDPCVILLMISRNNAPGNFRELHTYVCIRTLHYENRLRRLLSRIPIARLRDGTARQSTSTTTDDYFHVCLYLPSQALVANVRAKLPENYFSSFFFFLASMTSSVRGGGRVICNSSARGRLKGSDLNWKHVINLNAKWMNSFRQKARLLTRDRFQIRV